MTRRCMSHTNNVGSTFPSPMSWLTHFCPHSPSLITTSNRSAPASVRWYSARLLSPCAFRVTTPASSRVLRRCVRRERGIRGIPYSNSLNLRLPIRSSRIISGVQRSAKISAAMATGRIDCRSSSFTHFSAPDIGLIFRSSRVYHSTILDRPRKVSPELGVKIYHIRRKSTPNFGLILNFLAAQIGN